MGVVIGECKAEHWSAWRDMRRRLYAGEQEHLLAGEERQIEESGRLKGQPFVRFIALLDGEPVGFAEATIRSSAENCLTGPVAYLESWFVEAPYRGRSIGRALLEAVEAWGRAHGCEEIGSDTRVENSQSTAAHYALGFEDAGVIRCFRKRLV